MLVTRLQYWFSRLEAVILELVRFYEEGNTIMDRDVKRKIYQFNQPSEFDWVVIVVWSFWSFFYVTGAIGTREQGHAFAYAEGFPISNPFTSHPWTVPTAPVPPAIPSTFRTGISLVTATVHCQIDTFWLDSTIWQVDVNLVEMELPGTSTTRTSESAWPPCLGVSLRQVETGMLGSF